MVAVRVGALAVFGVLGVLSFGLVAPASARAPVARAAAFPSQSFASRADLMPPQIKVNRRARHTAGGYVFLTTRSAVGGQDGPLIVDDRGQVVWFQPRPGRPSNLHVIQYRGAPHLAWWEGQSFAGYGRGYWVVADASYREVARIKAGNGIQADFHDVEVTGNSAIMISYVTVKMDLSSIGGAPNTNVLDNVVQEVDLRTGKVLFQWSALDHVPLRETYRLPPKQPGQPYDYLHINSLDIDTDGNLLVSGRRTNAVYKVDRRSGAIIWRLGGKRSTFKLAPDARFRLQHDVERQPDGSISVFDNGEQPPYRQSRGISLKLDSKTLTAKLRRSNRNPAGKLSASQGNFQALAGGHYFAGWGSLPNFTEFSRKGHVLFDAQLPDQVNSYRAYRFKWSGHPTGRPALVARARKGGAIRLKVSWNGATDVRTWQVLAGRSRSSLRRIRSEPRRGFETTIDLRTRMHYFAVRGRDVRGKALGISRTVGR